MSASPVVSMQKNCKSDINFMYLLEEMSAPDHATFARFRRIHFSLCAKWILAEMPNLLYDLGEILGETIADILEGVLPERPIGTLGRKTKRIT